MEASEISGFVGGIITIIVGLIITFRPRLVAYVIGLYLIIIGIIAVVGALA